MPLSTLAPHSALDFAPQVVSEHQLTLFQFYLNQTVHAGMTYNNELYGLIQEFTTADRLEAYRCGCEWIGQGVPTIIGVSKQRYSVWISLRNPLATTFAGTAPE